MESNRELPLTAAQSQMLDLSSLGVPIAELVIEFVAVVAISRWHIRISSDASSELLAR